MLHFVSFGSGSSGNCSLLYTDTEALVIDAGVGVRTLKKYLKSYGLSLFSALGIIITHDHADHVRSVGCLSHDYNLPVYATLGVHEGIGKNWSVRKKIAPELKRVIMKDTPFMVGSFSITPFDVPHDSTDCVGYEIKYENTTFVIMTDIGHLTDDMKQYIARANYLVIEADYEQQMLESGPYPQHLKDRISGPYGHQSNAECAQALVECATPNLHHVWLCHLSDENNHPDLADKQVKQILREHGIVAGDEPGADFDLDVLKRKTPSEIFNLG
jgi:phosphoribosyl 1,2-cyclic phosphodiesterase